VSQKTTRLKTKTSLKPAKQSPARRKLPALATDRRFSHLLRSLSQEDTKVVLSFGGGGIRMFAHLSVLRFLEKLGAESYISEIWGASGGAIIGLAYARGISPDAFFEKAMELGKTRSFKISPSLFSVAKSLAFETLSFTSGPKIMKGFHNIQEGLQLLVGHALKTGKEKYPCYFLVYNLETNRTEVLTPEPVVPKNLYPGWLFHADPMDAIIASSSVPILFVPKVIDDTNGRRVYADGSTAEEIPTISIYKKWCRDKEVGLEKRKRLLVIAVDLHSDFTSLGFVGNWLLQRIPAFQYLEMTIRLTDLVRKSRIEDQKRVLTEDPNVELWELDLNLPGGGLLNVKLIPRIIELAEKSFPEQFAKINDAMLF